MKNTHLEHLEDDILNSGSAGGKNAIQFLRELGKMLSQPKSGIKITTKWDGAPAIVCGTDPQTQKFFVGTKSVFAKTNPKVMYSAEQIDQNYKGQLAQKLKDCLTYLPKLGIQGVVQGDLLFTNDKKKDIINGVSNIVFTPNTITYAVPEICPLGFRIASAKLGIVFHTAYSGPSLQEMSASFGVDISKFKNTFDVFVASADFNDATGSASFTPGESRKFTSLVNRADGSLRQASKFLDVLSGTGESKFVMSSIFKQFFNTYIREGKRLPSAKEVTIDFAVYYSMLMDKEIASKKTERTQKKYKDMKDMGLKFIQANQRPIYFTIASYMNLQEAKLFVIRKLEQVKDLGTFLKTEHGYRVTAPEGFVAIKSGKALKLVDRLEFSRANFSAAKSWDKA
jgi:hypothetical protein